MSRDSSNITQSEALRVATTRQGSTENIISSRSNEAYRLSSCSTPTICLSESAANTEPQSVSVVAPFRYDVTLRGVLDLFHIKNFSNASEEELMFLFGLHFSLCTAAKKLARELDGKADHHRLLEQAQKRFAELKTAIAEDNSGEPLIRIALLVVCNS